LLVDRGGTRAELIPHVLGGNERPTRQRGVWLWFRHDSGIIVPEAFRVLQA
jgi:predicted phage gp36 major capsid-like protein